MDWRILYNPLAVLGKGKGLVAAVLVIVVLTAVAWWAGVHLDGALDLHILPKPPSATLIIAESLIAWLSLGLFLFAASKVFGGNGGAGAHLAAAGLSRFPYILAAIVGSRQALGKVILRAVTAGKEEITVRPQELLAPAMIIGALAITAFVVWAVVMLYLGYKEAGRVQGGRAAASFIIGLIFAELVGKLLVIWLMRAGI